MSQPVEPATLVPPQVIALKKEAGDQEVHRTRMERSVSEDFRFEKEDLKEAAEHSQNVILNLSLDGVVRFVTPSWQDIIGTTTDSVIGRPIAEVVVEGKTSFQDAIAELQRDDSKSQVIRFSVTMGPLSSYSRKMQRHKQSESTGELSLDAFAEEETTLNLEAQGIMVYDRASGGETNTMWMIRPYVIREVTIDLPDMLVESLGVGAEMLAQYLNELTEAGVSDPGSHPPPLPVLCRICERQIEPWWFEKHTELCLQEHRAEMDVQLAQDSLQEHRGEIVKVLDGLDAQARQSRIATSGELAPPPISLPEYKGHVIGPASSSSSGPPSNASSGRASPASPSHSRDRSSSSFGHNRARSFAIRRPVARIVELVLDLCDTALEINTPALNQTRSQPDGDFRTQSPQSENRISQVMQWHSPTTVEQETGLAVLCDDTARLSKLKVDAIFRHRHILEYSERIRIEFYVLVQECIEAAMDKAARIAAGEISDSSTDTEGQETDHPAGEIDNQLSTDEHLVETGMFPGSFESSSAMNMALRNASNPSLMGGHDRRASSTATSTRSSSPRGSQTPRSHAGVPGLTQSKRGSIYFESDTGADSDSSIISSGMPVPRRTESPGSDVGLSRVHSSRDRKRKSLILPSVMSRQHSPARSIQPPSSPLRMAKNRIPSDNASSQSPITSPVLTTSEFSSPSIVPQHLQIHHHRRQSSAASSEPFRPASSPRLGPVSSNPQPKAVPPSIKDFEIIKPISKGAFGSVYLSKKKSTGDYFAIKVLKKADMVAKNQVTNVKAERAIMMWQGESDFVAKLYWTFSSKDYLYLVMEYLNGGDCASLIKVLGGLPEDWSKKYVAEVVLGIQHLHSRGIVHRDLKPDNLLIDQKGHLKLTDFGLSRMGLVGRQKRALNSKSDEPPVPDLLKQGPFQRTISVGSSRSASFDLHGSHSPNTTPSLTAAVSGENGQPSYFSLSRDTSRKTSGHKTDSETSEGLQAMFRKFSMADENSNHQAQSPIEEESRSGETSPPELYALQPVTSHISNVHSNTPPPAASGMLPPSLALFDPQDTTRKFVGTPDYLAPETINGIGQDEVSDWWSLGCILFEVLYGYPPFHAESPDEVFQNILDRKIDWPSDEVCPVSPEVKDLMNKLMCSDPLQRLGANTEDKFDSGGDEIRSHPWFSDINWETLRDDEASFVPAPENPEDTEYFDARGASLENFAAEFEDQTSSPVGTPGAEFHERPHDALSRVRTQVNSIKRSLMPLHIPPHVRDSRARRLSEPVAADDFGNFSYKNLPVLEKANKDVIQKLRAEAMQAQNKPGSAVQSPTVSSPSPPSLESSPVLPMPLKRTMSATKNAARPSSPLMFGQPSASPNRISQPSSPLLVQFSTGQNHERRKASSGSSSLSQGSASLQPPTNNFFEAPRMMTSLKSASNASSPIKLAKSPGANLSSHERSMSAQRMTSHSSVTSPRQRSHTISSQESEDIVRDLLPTSKHHKRRSQVVDISPSSSDNEESRQKAAFLRVQRRRQSSRRMSQITLDQGPMFRPLDVLICEDHPVSRLVMEKLLEKHRCRTITAQTGPEAMRYAMSEIKYDIIMMECKLPQINGADVARMIRDTKNTNTNTPIVCVTGYLKELPPNHHFDGLIDKPPTLAKLGDMLGRLCQWKPPPSNWNPAQQYALMPLSGLRQGATPTDDSPTSNTSIYTNAPSGSYRGSSREDSISSSFCDTSSQPDEVPVVINKHGSVEWHDRDLAQAFDGLGISEELLQDQEQKPTIPALLHQASAPGHLEHSVPRKKLSAERMDEKRRSMEKQRRDSADSGDDEDDELGNIQRRARSPKASGRPRGSSKLGTEMMRTNSRGSVVSVDDISSTDALANSPPPAIAEERPAEEALESPKNVSITPPELFPRLPGAAVEDFDMDAEPATPKPSVDDSSHDPDPTPRPSLSSVSRLEATGSPSPKSLEPNDS